AVTIQKLPIDQNLSKIRMGLFDASQSGVSFFQRVSDPQEVETKIRAPRIFFAEFVANRITCNDAEKRPWIGRIRGMFDRQPGHQYECYGEKRVCEHQARAQVQNMSTRRHHPNYHEENACCLDQIQQ